MSLDLIFRIMGMIVFGLGGSYFGVSLNKLAGGSIELWAIVLGMVGALLGFVLAPYITIRPAKYVLAKLKELSTQTLFAGILGLILSLIISALIAYPLSLLGEPFNQWLPFGAALVICYFGVSIFISRKKDFLSAWKSLLGKNNEQKELSTPYNPSRQILLDTSVIIDSRIADIAKTGFLTGELIIPRFVLNELQYIADSSDTMRRQRGRRGLEVLSKMQKDSTIPVIVNDMDVEGAQQVDDKLVLLAKQLGAPVLTNDFNLNRVAELQGVRIMNINELANAVKAVHLPGEKLLVRVIQEGRESGQGLAYLEDGTMVVVQGGNEFVGVELSTVVTKVLQTAAGRMIFARIENRK